MDSSSFPSLQTWKDNKIKELCLNIATFFNYISHPRTGFLQVENENTALSVLPTITREMASYVLGELYPCSSMLKEAGPINAISNYDSRQIEELIISKLKNITVHKDNIQPGVIQSIWTYVNNGMNDLMSGSTTDEEVAEKIARSERLALNVRNTVRNYGFNEDIENCAFQTLVYIIVALVDWLELDHIGKLEVSTAYKIIVPKDLRIKLSGGVTNAVSHKIILDTFSSKNLIISNQAIEMISKIMQQVGERLNGFDYNNPNGASKRFITRFTGLSQVV